MKSVPSLVYKTTNNVIATLLSDSLNVLPITEVIDNNTVWSFVITGQSNIVNFNRCLQSIINKRIKLEI